MIEKELIPLTPADMARMERGYHEDNGGSWYDPDIINELRKRREEVTKTDEEKMAKLRKRLMDGEFSQPDAIIRHKKTTHMSVSGTNTPHGGSLYIEYTPRAHEPLPEGAIIVSHEMQILSGNNIRIDFPNERG